MKCPPLYGKAVKIREKKERRKGKKRIVR